MLGGVANVSETREVLAKMRRERPEQFCQAESAAFYAVAEVSRVLSEAIANGQEFEIVSQVSADSIDDLPLTRTAGREIHIVVKRGGA